MKRGDVSLGPREERLVSSWRQALRWGLSGGGWGGTLTADLEVS